MGFAERLKFFRENHLGMDQRSFGLAIGVAGRDTISLWERGKHEPNNKYITAMRIKFRLNPEWLRTGQGPMLLEEEPAGLETPQATLSYVPSRPPERWKGPVQDRLPGFEDNLLYDIVVMIETRLQEKNLELSPEDYGAFVEELHKLYRRCAIPVTMETVASFVDLKARPRGSGQK